MSNFRRWTLVPSSRPTPRQKGSLVSRETFLESAETKMNKSKICEVLPLSCPLWSLRSTLLFFLKILLMVFQSQMVRSNRPLAGGFDEECCRFAEEEEAGGGGAVSAAEAVQVFVVHSFASLDTFFQM